MSADYCDWLEDDDGHWETECGSLHGFFEGGPYENHYTYCPYCGERIWIEQAPEA